MFGKSWAPLSVRRGFAVTWVQPAGKTSPASRTHRSVLLGVMPLETQAENRIAVDLYIPDSYSAYNDLIRRITQ